MANLAILVSRQGLKGLCTTRNTIAESSSLRPWTLPNFVGSPQLKATRLQFQTAGGPLVLPVWVLLNPPPDTKNPSAWRTKYLWDVLVVPHDMT